MKRYMVILLAILLSMQASAEVNKFVSGDGSDLSALCIAATQSVQKMRQVADELGIHPINQATLVCNEMPLMDFVRRYREKPVNDVAAYSFHKSDDSLETELCYAAVTSASAYENLKELYLNSLAQEEQLLCNRTPIKQFIQRYQQEERQDIAALMQ